MDRHIFHGRRGMLNVRRPGPPGPPYLEREFDIPDETMDALAAEYETNPYLQELAADHPGIWSYEGLFRMLHRFMVVDQSRGRFGPWEDILWKIGWLKEDDVEGGGGDEGHGEGMRPLRGLRSEASRAGRSAAGSRRGSVSQGRRGPPMGPSRGPSRRPSQRPSQMGPSPLDDEYGSGA
ncbi:MAG: hypothetical protein Q9207_008557 [Kuettlingeria erythrocarpa]